MFFGNDIIEYIANKLDLINEVSSSHWNHYHKRFKYHNGYLSGLDGFGVLSPPYVGFLKYIHFLFQFIYRYMAPDQKFFKTIDQKANYITSIQKRANNLDVIRQSLTITLLEKKINFNRINTAIVIGDGFATMTTLLIENNLVERVYLINLKKTLLVDIIYFKKAIGDSRFKNEVVLINERNSLMKLKKNHKVVFIEAANYDLLMDVEKDLVINIASFQEMSKKTIDNYFKYIYNGSKNPFYFYICNREEKELPDGEIIRFENYKFDSDDQILIDELCPWHQYYYTKRPFFFKKYDGPVRHQLRLTKNN